MGSPREPADVLSELTKPPVQARMLDWLRRSLGSDHPAARSLELPDDPEYAESISLERWRTALGLAVQDAPGESVEARWRWLGGKMTEGFFASELGSLIALSLQGASAERYVSTLPKVLALGRSDVTAEVYPAPAGGWLVHIDDQAPLPDFVAGSLERALRRVVASAKVDVSARCARGYTLHATW